LYRSNCPNGDTVTAVTHPSPVGNAVVGNAAWKMPPPVESVIKGSEMLFKMNELPLRSTRENLVKGRAKARTRSRLRPRL
jgi:hypothetical protein